MPPHQGSSHHHVLRKPVFHRLFTTFEFLTHGGSPIIGPQWCAMQNLNPWFLSFGGDRYKTPFAFPLPSHLSSSPRIQPLSSVDQRILVNKVIVYKNNYYCFGGLVFFKCFVIYRKFFLQKNVRNNNNNNNNNNHHNHHHPVFTVSDTGQWRRKVPKRGGTETRNLCTVGKEPL